MNYHHGNLRRELLDRAAQVIAKQGIENLSLRALAQDLGVSHGAPARHFKDKLDLLRALATEGHNKLADYVFAAAEAAGPDPLERYAALGRAFVRFSLEYPAYYQAARHPEVAAHADQELEAASRRRMEMTAEAARQAQAAGWLQGESVEDAVTFSLAAVRGVPASSVIVISSSPEISHKGPKRRQVRPQARSKTIRPTVQDRFGSSVSQSAER